MRSSAIHPVLLCSLMMLTACGARPVQAVPPPPAKPTSSWTSADSQAVAKELTESAEKQQWLIAFRTRTNRPPKLWIADIQDHSGDHVDVEELAADLEKDLADSQQVTVVQDRDQADFVINGVVGREPIAGGSRYPVDLRLISHEGDTVWVGSLERDILTPTVPATPTDAQAPTHDGSAPAPKAP